jgi:multidrug efflux pump subunit AcrA (membrane-fusion protein)
VVACEDAKTPSRAVPDASADHTTYVPVQTGEDHAVIEAPARLVATATSSGDVTFLASGVVRRVFVQPGDRVKAGAPLLEIASPTLAEAAGEWRSTMETLKIAEDRLRRLEALAEERIASQDELQARREDIARLRGRRRQLKAILRAHGVEPSRFDAVHRNGSVVLTSPVDGAVTRLSVRLGQVVGPDRGPLLTVVGAGRPRVEALLQQRPSDELTHVFVASDGTRYAVRSTPVGTVSDPQTGTWTTWFELADDVRIVGERVGELLGSAPGPDVFTIPVEALGRAGEDPFVARRRDGETPERVGVEVLHQDDHIAVIRAGLDSGDHVALDPRATLAAEAQ